MNVARIAGWSGIALAKIGSLGLAWAVLGDNAPMPPLPLFAATLLAGGGGLWLLTRSER
jgi:hypothetical protein